MGKYKSTKIRRKKMKEKRRMKKWKSGEIEK
jgi:hypothetical protein